MLAKVFQSGNSQAVRLPKEFRFDAKEVNISKSADSVILTPVKNDFEKAFFALTELKDAFQDFERNDLPPQERDFSGTFE
jgi:antitoxin VapB